MGTEVHTLTATLLSAGLDLLAYSKTPACDTSRQISPVPV